MNATWKRLETLADALSTRGPTWRAIGGVIRSRYFLASAGFYLLILLIIGGYRLSTYPDLQGVFDSCNRDWVQPPPISLPPPSAPTRVDKPTTKDVPPRSAAASLGPAVSRIAAACPSAFHRQPMTPDAAPAFSPGGIKIETSLADRIREYEIARLVNAREFQRAWKVRRFGKATTAEFTVFQARYNDGDWNCNPAALENLLLQIRRWSRGRLEANLHPEVLDVGTDQLFEIKPPFVYLTGHKNFTLLDKEVENLRDYLMLSGAVWADSALAGRRSRFDVAFRREMGRVLPDRAFEPVPPDHDMFSMFFDNIRLPTGMNAYHESAEIVTIGGLLAVLYTSNGYGHFWESRMDANNRIEWTRIKTGVNPRTKKPVWSHVYGPHLRGHEMTSVLYRNIGDETVCASYKFGINVVVHLLTRYQETFRNLPLEPPGTPPAGARPGAG